MAGENGALWIVSSGAADGTEATANGSSPDNVMLFNDTGKVIGDGGAYLTDIHVNFRRAVPENEAVDIDNNEIQDMGVDGLDVILTGITGNADNDATSNGVNKLSLWIQSGNTTVNYTKGRYGLRLDNAPQWNVTPTSTYGYHIRDVDIQYLGENKDQARFTIRLALGGDILNAI